VQGRGKDVTCKVYGEGKRTFKIGWEYRKLGDLRLTARATAFLAQLLSAFVAPRSGDLRNATAPCITHALAILDERQTKRT
jgi:hypothetical protein